MEQDKAYEYGSSEHARKDRKAGAPDDVVVIVRRPRLVFFNVLLDLKVPGRKLRVCGIAE